jgi:transcription initiation factor TFIIIB Brf1 subunit/transcription initiation factor TFIIB
MSSYCEFCQTETETYESNEGTVCTNCGVVIQGLAFNEDATWAEDSHGRQQITGTRVMGTGANTLQGLSGVSVESRQVTINKASKRISALASEMKISYVQEAINTYTLALGKGFTT